MFKNIKIRIANQPYFLFLVTGFVLTFSTLFMFGQSVDFHLHDTYFIVSINYFILALAGLFFISWTIYKLIDRFLWTKILTWTHVLLTILVLILLSTIGFWHGKILPPIKSETISYQNIIDDQKRKGIIAYLVMTIFVLGQVAYFVNLIVGLIKRRL